MVTEPIPIACRSHTAQVRKDLGYSRSPAEVRSRRSQKDQRRSYSRSVARVVAHRAGPVGGAIGVRPFHRVLSAPRAVEPRSARSSRSLIADPIEGIAGWCRRALGCARPLPLRGETRLPASAGSPSAWPIALYLSIVHLKVFTRLTRCRPSFLVNDYSNV